MITTERTITICGDKSKIDEPILLYRGDFEVEVKFKIFNSKYKFQNGLNLIAVENAAYGQLAILAPNGDNVFSDVTKCVDGTVSFVVTETMIDELKEVGKYSFQIRLFDANRDSRVTTPPVEFGLIVGEPVASEDTTENVNDALVGYSIARATNVSNESAGPTFDGNKYNKTKWEIGDRITADKLNKLEDALDTINENNLTTSGVVKSNYSVLDAIKANKDEIFTMANMGQDVKEAMTGGSVAVVGNNSVLNDNIVDRQISSIKLANDLEYYTADDGEPGVVSQTTGVHSPGATRIWSTKYIPVNEEKTYIIQCRYDGINRLPFAMYDKQMVFIGGMLIDCNETILFTPPENVAYIRISMMREDRGSFKMIPIKKLKEKNMKKNSIQISSLTLINEKSVNLLRDINDITKDVYTNYDGVETDFVGLYTTPYIAVKPNKTYYTKKKNLVTAKKTVCLYDAEKNCLSRSIGSVISNNIVELVIPVDCYFIKLNGFLDDVSLVDDTYIFNDYLVENLEDIEHANEPLTLSNNITLNHTQNVKVINTVWNELNAEVLDKSKNLYNSNDPDFETGCYYDNPTYVRTEHAKLSTSGYIKVNEGECYAVKVMIMILGTKIGWYYNSLKSPTSPMREFASNTYFRLVEVPRGSEYMRVHVNHDYTNSMLMRLDDNIIDKSANDYENGCYYDDKHNKITDSAYDTTGYISVKQGGSYLISLLDYSTSDMIGWYYNADKIAIEPITELQRGKYHRIIEIPQNVSYIRITVNNTKDAKVVEIPASEIYEPYGYTLKDTVRVSNEKDRFMGMKFNFMGDSITAGTGTTKTYWSYMADDLGITAKGYGISGSRIADGSNPMYSRVLKMDDDADFIFVFGGTNDFNSDTTLGELYTLDDKGKRIATSSTDTFYGALHTMCVNLINKYPDKKIVLMTPIHREVFSNQHLDTEPNDKGIYLTQYVNAIKEIGEWYSIPVLDLYATSGMNPNIPIHKELYFSPTDGLHPKAEGHRRLADCIIAFIKTI